MTVGNIAIVIGPNLLWPADESADPAYVALCCLPCWEGGVDIYENSYKCFM